MVSKKITMLKVFTCLDTWPNKNWSIISLKYQPKSHKAYCAGHIKHTVHNLFNVCSNWTMIKLPWTRKKKKSSFCFWHTFDLEQGQGQQTWYEFEDPKQGNNHAKFERSHYNGIWEKANVEVFFSSKDMCELSPMNTCKGKKQNKNKSGIFMIWSVHITNNHTKLQLNRTRT